MALYKFCTIVIIITNQLQGMAYEGTLKQVENVSKWGKKLDS